jgi:DNA-binding CsgD family transcriptional regulator/Tfp pilus assembly protein PilF
MPAPTLRNVVCPVLVGRAQHVDSIEHVIEAVASGRGQSAAICGEAGIGKSRLVAETKARMSGRGALILQGNCFEPDATLPYAPILDLLRACFATRAPDEVAACIGPDAPELVKLLPELTAILPGLAPAPPLDPEQEKRRIFLALAQFFARLAAKQPLLVVIEDVHWSDDTSLEFLLYAARRIESLPILLLLTFRSDEVQPPLGHFLAQMERERFITEWPLSRLGPPEVDQMIRAIFDLDAAVRADFLDAICSLTEGNPFFIEEVLKSLVASGGIFYEDGTWDRKPLSELNIPRSVHDAVRVRTDQLSADARQLLTLAAVTGRRFDFSLLQRVSQHDERDLLVLIKELMSAQLVIEESDDQFSFRHALTQHVIYSGLLARERRTLHRTIAEHMRQMYSASVEAHLADLANHFYQAGAWDEAYYYCRRVGANAQTLFASRAAVEHLTRAIEAAGHLSIAPPSKLFRERGQSLELIGEFERAREDYARALEMARNRQDGLAEWQALIDLGFLWAGRDYARADEFFRDATDLARTLGDQRLMARSLNRLGNWYVNTGEPEEGLRGHRDALAIFDALDDQHGRASTLDLMGMANGIHGNIAACYACVDEAVGIFRQLGDDQGLVSSVASRGSYSSPSMQEVAHSAFRSFEDASGDALEALDIATRIGWQSGRAYARFTASGVCSGFGEFGDAIRHGNESLRLAAEIGHQQWEIAARFTLGQAYVFMGAPDLARHHLEQALPSARKLGSAWWIGNVTSYLALAYLMGGDHRRARAGLNAAMPPEQQPRTLAERRLLLAWAALALDEGDAAGAIAISDRLIASVPGKEPQAVPAPLYTKARALLALGRADDAEAALVQAESAAAERHDRPLLWRIQRDLGRLYGAAGRRDEATAKAAQSRALVETLAATIDDDRLREQFRAAALDAPVARRPGSLRQTEKAAYGGLTARERDVAALIAQGKSNRDIAEALVLGERTIETHVGNVLSKLRFSSRSQIAAWAVQVRLPGKPQ